jgi:tRNA dimethylallyltransferase
MPGKGPEAAPVSAIALVCLLGATGTGKTEAAIRLAAAFGGEVINYDSRQIYRDLPVITAQPTPEETARCPHHLYGFLPASSRRSAGSFARLVHIVVNRVHGRGRLPILVGGTGLYLRAILSGLAPIPDIPATVRRNLVEECGRLGPKALHERLAAIDPAYALRIAPTDRQRITRALEVHLATGRTLSDWHARQQAAPGRYAAVSLGLTPPPDHAGRLSRRIEAMIAQGAVDEAARAAAKYPDGAWGLSGIGCAELLRHLSGELSLAAAKDLWLHNTRAYAKRQMTWFRKEPQVSWFAPDDHAGMAAAVRQGLETA